MHFLKIFYIEMYNCITTSSRCGQGGHEEKVHIGITPLIVLFRPGQLLFRGLG